MKNKKLVIITVLLIIFIGIIIILFFNKKEKVIDEDILYSQKFGDTIINFKVYDYTLGQRMLVSVLKSFDKGKNFDIINKSQIQVSLKAQFIFLTEKIGFIVDTGYLERDKDFNGLLVTNDGGITFNQATITYDNENVSLISIEELPYYENNKLILKCSVYEVNQEKEVIYYSDDNGNTWYY